MAKFTITVYTLECESKRIDEEIARLKHRNKRFTTSINALKKETWNNSERIQRLQKDVNEREIVIKEWVEWKKELITELEEIKEL